MFTWRRVALENVPNSPGCYAIYYDDALVYLGSTLRLNSRLLAHARTINKPKYCHVGPRPKDAGTKDVVVSFKIALCRRSGEWLMREYRLIKRLSPRDNRAIAGHWRVSRKHLLTQPLDT